MTNTEKVLIQLFSGTLHVPAVGMQVGQFIKGIYIGVTHHKSRCGWDYSVHYFLRGKNSDKPFAVFGSKKLNEVLGRTTPGKRVRLKRTEDVSLDPGNADCVYWMKTFSLTPIKDRS